MISAARSLITRAARDEQGAVAPMFGVTAIVLFLAGGIAIDVGIASHAKNKIASAIDAAALATAKGMREQNLSVAEGQALARRYFDANVGNLGNLWTTMTRFDPQIDQRSGAVTINVEASVKTFFGGLAGINRFAIPSTAVALVEGKDIEVGLQLDVTGSMNSRQGSGTRMDALKLATRDLLDILIPDVRGPQRVRVGLAPYSAGVNAGPYARLVNGNRSDTCVYERQNLAFQASDAAPSGPASLKVRADLSGSVNGCSASEVVPLSEDKTMLKNRVDGFGTGGSTAGHLGTAWASYLISPDWSGVWPSASTPAPFNDGRTMKFAILMTDGDYNTVGGRNFGDNDPQSDDYAVDTCAAMKASPKRITIYTVGFGNTLQAQAENTLRNCASDSSKFYLARDEDELRRAFREIAQDITSLRLTR